MTLTVNFLNILLTVCSVYVFISGLRMHSRLLLSIREQKRLNRRCSYTLLQICRGMIVYSLLYSIGIIRWMTDGTDELIGCLDSMAWIVIEFAAVLVNLKILELGDEVIGCSRERRISG
jgi:hypothetical protein